MDAADEYDRYLLHVAVRLQRGEPDDALIDYLLEVETNHIGMDVGATTRERAAATVTAIRAHVESLNTN